MRGEYNTRQKRELMEYLDRHDLDHYSVDELVFRMEEDGKKIGRSTIYRCLEALAGQGGIRKYQNAQGVTQYQPVRDSAGCARHFHMMCRRCGKLYHVECDLMEKLYEHICTEHAFRIDMRETVMIGVCEKCAAEEAKVCP